MISVKKSITVKEYDTLVSENAPAFVQGERISQKAFNELTQLINESPDQDDNDHGIIFWQRGQKLQVRHYVGMIQTSDGTQVEILPKISGSFAPEQLRRIFLKMLREVGELPYKSGKNADLSLTKFPLLEIFIHDFLNTIDQVVKRGIRSDYVRQEDNQAFIKGKLLMNAQLKHNLIRRDRFYVEYDNFEVNRPENRLIKASLQKVLKVAKQLNNQRLARELLFAFGDVPQSTEYKQDLQKCSQDRGMHYYQDALHWCKLILNDLAPVPKAGERSFRSFLFPMPQLFERYVAKVLLKKLPDWQVHSQASHKKLMASEGWEKELFVIKPDLLLKKDDKTVIADTKWKLLDMADTKNKFNIHQGDLYQLFTYAKFYKSEKVILIYPKTDNFSEVLQAKYVAQNCKVVLIPFDLEADQISIDRIYETLTDTLTA
ncbi:MAG: McrC family protein [Methylococcaceae bacterium]